MRYLGTICHDSRVREAFLLTGEAIAYSSKEVFKRRSELASSTKQGHTSYGEELGRGDLSWPHPQNKGTLVMVRCWGEATQGGGSDIWNLEHVYTISSAAEGGIRGERQRMAPIVSHIEP